MPHPGDVPAPVVLEFAVHHIDPRPELFTLLTLRGEIFLELINPGVLQGALRGEETDERSDDDPDETDYGYPGGAAGELGE